MLQKMMRLTVFLLFLSCVFCLATGQTHNSYNEMEPRLKSFVDLALNKANRQFSYGHLNFDKIGEVHEVAPWVRIDVRLKNTACRKVEGANDHKQRPECPFKKLEVRCFVCRPDPKNQTIDPYIDCVRRKDQATRYNDWDQNCLPNLPPPEVIDEEGSLTNETISDTA